VHAGEDRAGSGHAIGVRGTKRLVALLAVLVTLGVPWVVSSNGVALAAQNPNGSAGLAGTAGELLIQRSGHWRELQLPSPATDVDVRMNVSSNKVATGLGQSVTIIARRSGANNEYRARVRFLRDGSVTLAIVRLVNGSRRIISPTKRIAGLVHR